MKLNELTSTSCLTKIYIRESKMIVEFIEEPVDPNTMGKHRFYIPGKGYYESEDVVSFKQAKAEAQRIAGPGQAVQYATINPGGEFVSDERNPNDPFADFDGDERRAADLGRSKRNNPNTFESGINEDIRINYKEVPQPQDNGTVGDWLFVDHDNGQIMQFSGPFGKAAMDAKQYYATIHRTNFGIITFRGGA